MDRSSANLSRVSRRTGSPRPRRDTTRPNNNIERNNLPRDKQPFDGLKLVQSQNPNEMATALDLSQCSSLRLLHDVSVTLETNPSLESNLGNAVQQPCFSYLSLDDVFPNTGFSNAFTDESFRDQLRSCIRQDVFNSNPSYSRISSSAKVDLISASSIQGSWNIATPRTDEFLSRELPNIEKNSMILSTIGALCGEFASTHFIDIIGVQDRTVTHSWHQDTGLEGNTVLWGFPKGNNYEGCGVYTHIVPLRRSHHAPPNHPINEPVLFQGQISEDHIVRPNFGKGRELLVYRDLDILHSAPDVTYRCSVMRFM